MGQQTNRKFAITTGEVVFIFLLGILIGAFCMSIAGCQEFNNVSHKRIDNDAAPTLPSSDGGKPDTVLQDTSPVAILEASLDGRTDSGFAEREPRDGAIIPRLDSTPDIGTTAETGPQCKVSQCPPGPLGGQACCLWYDQCGHVNSLGTCSPNKLCQPGCGG